MAIGRVRVHFSRRCSQCIPIRWHLNVSHLSKSECQKFFVAVFVALALSRSRPFPHMMLSTFIQCALHYHCWDSNEIDRKELIESFFSGNWTEKIDATLSLCVGGRFVHTLLRFFHWFLCAKSWLTTKSAFLSHVNNWARGREGDAVIISVVSVHIVHAWMRAYAAIAAHWRFDDAVI